MSQVYSRTVKAVGDTNVIFDRLCATVRSRGFNIITAEKPNLIIGDRGILRPTRRIEKYPHSIVIAIHAVDTNPVVSFSYIMNDMWDYTAGDQDFFNNEINSVVASLNINFTVIDMKAAQESAQATPSYVGELKGLAMLRDNGVISADEFDRKKRNLMGV
jgi:hypothetical protein